MNYDPATVRAVCKALRVAAVPGHPWQGAADFIESRFPAEPPPPEPSTDTLRGCPHDPVCQHCPCAAEDDVCFPGERLRAERDTLREALERIAAIADPYPARIARAALAATPAREDEGR